MLVVGSCSRELTGGDARISLLRAVGNRPAASCYGAAARDCRCPRGQRPVWRSPPPPPVPARRCSSPSTPRSWRSTVCRPSLVRAVRSVFRQAGVSRLQVLIGIDGAAADAAAMPALLAERPAQHAVTVLDLGYSTSVRHGGVYATIDGGALRTILTYAANSRFVAYLDDDNWVGETHIARLLGAIQGRDWAFTLRWFVDPVTDEPLSVDRWEVRRAPTRAFREQVRRVRRSELPDDRQSKMRACAAALDHPVAWRRADVHRPQRVRDAAPAPGGRLHGSRHALLPHGHQRPRQGHAHEPASRDAPPPWPGSADVAGAALDLEHRERGGVTPVAGDTDTRHEFLRLETLCSEQWDREDGAGPLAHAMWYSHRSGPAAPG